MIHPQPASQEIFLQVLNLADGEIEVTVQGNRNNPLLVESISSFQNTTHYSKLRLETKSQDLHFHLKYNNLSVHNEYSVEEKNCYQLVVHENGESLSSMLVKDTGIKPANGMTAIRFGCWVLHIRRPHILFVLSKGDNQGHWYLLHFLGQ